MAISWTLFPGSGYMGRGRSAFNGLLLVIVLLAMPGITFAQNNRPLRIVAFGDSLTAGYGLPDGDSFPSQLQRALKARGHDVEIVNAGVSGDTTGMGLERFDWAIPEGAGAVIVELGANDALRGLPPEAARRNLEAILKKLAERKLPVLIAGMRAPRNLSEPYTTKFDRMYPELAGTYGALLYPFFLDGVALDAKLNLGDGIHPNTAGIAEIVRRMLPMVEELIGRAKAGG